MENIGSDGMEYTSVWKLLPEWMIDRLDSSLLACFLELRGVGVGFTESIQDRANVL